MRRAFSAIAIAVAMTVMIPSVASTASAATLPLTSQQTAMKQFLHSVLPSKTDAQLTALVRNPDYIKAIGSVKSVEVVGGPVTTSVSTTSAGMFTTSAVIWCRSAWATVKARGFFGTLFSFKLTKYWCWNGSRVTSARITAVKPDVTSYGSYFGWAYKGEFQPRENYYYTWRWHTYGGHKSIAHGEFTRCIGLQGIGCVDQKFMKAGVRGHYDGSYTFIEEMN